MPGLLAPSEFRELVSGQRRGVRAALLRGLLRLAEVPYSAAIHWRNRRFDQHGADIFRAPVPVVSVGNLTLGGTGKTPMVEWLARWFRQRGLRVTLISRGYRAQHGASSDEACELEERLADVPHLQDADRVRAAQTAVEELDCQVIVLDDAFQHRRIARDLDIVLIDALEPFGFGHVFPRGMLREPLAGLARADIVALSRADLIGAAQRAAVYDAVIRYAPRALWVELQHRPTGLRSSRGQTAPVESLARRSVCAFCGIGNPLAFHCTLTQCCYDIAAFREFPDHHPYGRTDVHDLAAWSNSMPAVEAVICTHKDLVKIDVEQLGRLPLWALTVAVEVAEGKDELEHSLEQLLRRVKE